MRILYFLLFWLALSILLGIVIGRLLADRNKENDHDY